MRVSKSTVIGCFGLIKDVFSSTRDRARENYPTFLVGAVFVVALIFSILSYRSQKSKEVFSLKPSQILGLKSGTISAVATASSEKVATTGLWEATVAAVSRPAPTVAPNFPLDLNRADATALDQLPGVGPATAKKIIEFRQGHGGFKKVEELLEVGGIGPKKFEQIKGLVRVGETP